jgi:hypothetical protein
VKCNSKTPVLLETGVCVSSCPPFHIQSTEDPTECVSFLNCPVGFTPVLGSNVECNKPSPLVITEGETCAAGYEEWERNLCYMSCPPTYTDNGLSCFKNTVTRDSAPAFQEETCGVFYSLGSNNTCKLSAIGIALLVVCILGLCYLLHIIYQHLRNLVRESKRPILVQDQILNKINSYFLSPSLPRPLN